MSASTDAVEALGNVDATLMAVEEQLSVFNEKSMEKFINELSPIEKAKVQVALAYSINALLYVYLKTQGVSTKDIRQTHVKQELDRVKGYIKKIKETEELATGPTLRLDKEASKRFVDNALSRDQIYAEARAAHEANTSTSSTIPSTPKRPNATSTNSTLKKKKNISSNKKRRKQ